MKNETYTYPFLYSSSEIYKFDFQQVSKLTRRFYVLVKKRKNQVISEEWKLSVLPHCISFWVLEAALEKLLIKIPLTAWKKKNVSNRETIWRPINTSIEQATLLIIITWIYNLAMTQHLLSLLLFQKLKPQVLDFQLTAYPQN
jgi:hypothetical protein